MLGLPGTELAVVSYPAPPWHRYWGEWHYWWQAHLIDCLVDAQLRAPDPARRARIGRVVRSHRLRNLTGWTNRYYDDMAWLGLALERTGRLIGIRRTRGLTRLTRQLIMNWTERQVSQAGVVIRVGGLPWRARSDLFNAPANGPAAILLARTGHLGRAQVMADWVYEVLQDPDTGLIIDGIRVNTLLHREIYSYCQGVVIGAGVELYRRNGDPAELRRVAGLVAAVESQLCHDGHALRGGGGGDGGLFNGILARYLALVVTDLPGNDEVAVTTRARAAAIVTASADACWAHRREIEHGPVFGPDWNAPAALPGPVAAPLPDAAVAAVDSGPATGSWVRRSIARVTSGMAGVARAVDGATASSAIPERDLSVQLGAWMLLEAAARIDRRAEKPTG